MPDAFKGHFTADENGKSVMLRKPEETKIMMEKFWEDARK